MKPRYVYKYCSPLNIEIIDSLEGKVISKSKTILDANIICESLNNSNSAFTSGTWGQQHTTGMSKLEYASIKILGNLLSASGSGSLPEHIAETYVDEAIMCAKLLLNKLK